MILPKNARIKVMGVVNPYIRRYCDKEYASTVKKILANLLSSNLILPKIDTPIVSIVKCPHTLVYDNKFMLKGTLKKTLINKSDSFKDGFYTSLLQLMRGSSIDLISRDDIDYPTKISYCQFFVNL